MPNSFKKCEQSLASALRVGIKRVSAILQNYRKQIPGGADLQYDYWGAYEYCCFTFN